MASKLQARIDKLEARRPKIKPAYVVWYLDGEYHERRTQSGEVIRLDAAEWQEHIKKDDCRVMTVKYADSETSQNALQGHF